jgi:hypothetical protein
LSGLAGLGRRWWAASSNRRTGPLRNARWRQGEEQNSSRSCSRRQWPLVSGHGLSGSEVLTPPCAVVWSPTTQSTGRDLKLGNSQMQVNAHLARELEQICTCTDERIRAGCGVRRQVKFLCFYFLKMKASEVKIHRVCIPVPEDLVN